MSSTKTGVSSAVHYPSLQSVRNTEFINNYYALSQEPLNLRTVGQRWFKNIYSRECSRRHSVALVLGGTPWLGTLLKEKGKTAIMVDINPAMLETAEAEVNRGGDRHSGRVEYVCANWLDMPEFSSPLDLIVGDNCLNFLHYPEGWHRFFDSLPLRLSQTAELMIRFIAIPATHKPMSIDAIVAKYLMQDSISYTEVRAQLLVANWDAGSMAIPTEHVVDMFEANQSKFEPLFRKFPAPQNDLTTIRKFKSSGCLLFTPPLQEILRFLSGYFRVMSIHFGPYGLSEYFPVIVAKRQ
jgi:SAM-dependent methyltransferase